jgi:hypothetical protein
MSMEFSFAPPPKLERLSAETLGAVGDDEIESSLVSYVGDLELDEANDPAALDRLSGPLRTWYVAFIVDIEILNGGFNQLFFNSSAVVTPEAPAAFAALGIPEAGDLVQRALALLDAHAPALEKAHEEGTIDAFMETYVDQPFEELDEAYSENEERWREARVRFIRERASEFSHT